MFGWFKKSSQATTAETNALADTLFGPQSLAIAIAECARDHFLAVKEGRIDYPAHRRKGSNVEAVWTDVRMEAFQRMFGFGLADPFMLCDMRRQAQLFSAFLNEQPHFEFPQPRGQPIADTLQSVWQIYVYLDQVGSEVMDRETNRESLKARGADIISAFTAEAVVLCDSWIRFEKAIGGHDEELPKMPRTMIEALWEDVTFKTKSIALSVIFGPYYEGGMAQALEIVKKNATKLEFDTVKASLDRVRTAKQPEDIRRA